MKKVKIIAWVLALILLLECLYCVAVFTDWVEPLSDLRDMYIETALGTMNHKWLATALIPGDIVHQVVQELEDARTAQTGQNSGHWEIETRPTEPEEESAFFARFPELDRDQVLDWVNAHPEAIENGWSNFYVNQAGLDEAGTDLYTRQRDQVLAIDAANGLCVLRVRGERYRGVLVLGKDPARLSCAPSGAWGNYGQRAGDIARDNGALVAMTGSGFHDGEGADEGAEQTGAAMCGGVRYGEHLKTGYKRIELRSDDKLYVVDAPGEFHPDCTDATEWTPALIVDGVTIVSKEDHYNALNPRCCLGQARDGTVLMLCIEGRYMDSLGATAPECAGILARYDAYQAMNVDGGTSAICWYQGEYITRCSNPKTPEGRYLPNAWIYR